MGEFGQASTIGAQQSSLQPLVIKACQPIRQTVATEDREDFGDPAGASFNAGEHRQSHRNLGMHRELIVGIASYLDVSEKQAANQTARTLDSKSFLFDHSFIMKTANISLVALVVAFGAATLMPRGGHFPRSFKPSPVIKKDPPTCTFSI